MSKSEQILSLLEQEIAAGTHGNAGDAFLTVRGLAESKGVSLRTAFRLMKELEKSGMVEKRGKGFRVRSFVPNKSITKRRLIGCVVTSLESPYFAKLVRHLEESLHRFGAGLLIASSDYSFEREQERIEGFLAQGVSGLLICPWADVTEERYYGSLPVPYVILGRRLASAEPDTVMVNNQLAAQAVADHLVRSGAEEFAYAGQSGTQNDERLFGFRAGLLAHEILLNPERIVRTDYSDGEKSASDLTVLLTKRTAGKRLGLFCYHDLFASRALNLCHKTGIKVPEEILIAGFDNLPIAEETYPRLTSVSYPIEAMARTAVETLYAKIRFPGAAKGICRCLDAELVVRGSTDDTK